MADQSPCDSCKVLEPMLDIHCCFQGSEVFFHHFGRLNSGKRTIGHITTTFLQQVMTVQGLTAHSSLLEVVKENPSVPRGRENHSFPKHTPDCHSGKDTHLSGLRTPFQTTTFLQFGFCPPQSSDRKSCAHTSDLSSSSQKNRNKCKVKWEMLLQIDSPSTERAFTNQIQITCN